MSIASAKERARAATDRILFGDDGACETVRITVDGDGVEDDVLDLETLELHPPSSDTEPLYEGPALVGPESTQREATDEGGARVYPERYQCRLPGSAPSIPRGALVVVVVSPKAHLVDRRFTVDEVPDSGRHVTSILKMFTADRGPRL